MDESPEGTEGRVLATFRDRLNYLFDVVHPPNRGPYSNTEVVALMAERGLDPISDVYLWKLRTGRSDNPTMRHFESLAKFFGVSPRYWFDDEIAERTERDLELLVLMRDARIKNVLLRLSDVSEKGKEALIGMVDHVREVEGLPPKDVN
ncbi:XRE family transcriptional regulator [Streptomyces sp. NPDC051561]|uniref:XRE family transcriptional regulator n=1 Tax=Streptomyces sp. NPDC051561 TaxID=3365658 RepID=UPI0037900CC1